MFDLLIVIEVLMMKASMASGLCMPWFWCLGC